MISRERLLGELPSHLMDLASSAGFTPQTLSATVTGGQTTQNVNFALTSTTGAATGTNLDGSALVAPDEVASIEVQNLNGHTFVAANL